jgi:two-component system, chemotaxis family, chemotaxis protein CheY
LKEQAFDESNITAPLHEVTHKVPVWTPADSQKSRSGLPGSITWGRASSRYPTTPFLPGSKGAHMRILVVDDSATMRRIVMRGLAEMGYTDIAEAENGQTALDLVLAGGIDLIITDWNMPVMNGLEFVTGVRASNSGIPILMVTTNASNQDVIQALGAGVTNYVVKPFTPATLKEKVLAVLGD